jgi:hypothetical protein
MFFSFNSIMTAMSVTSSVCTRYALILGIKVNKPGVSADSESALRTS